MAGQGLQAKSSMIGPPQILRSIWTEAGAAPRHAGGCCRTAATDAMPHGVLARTHRTALVSVDVLLGIHK